LTLANTYSHDMQHNAHNRSKTHIHLVVKGADMES